MLAVTCLFFPFLFSSSFPFHPNLSAATSPSPPPHVTLTQVISCQCHLNTATTAPTLWPLQPLPCHPLWAHQPPAAPTLTRVVGTQATPPLSPSLCLVHPKKPQISYFPFFSPSSLIVHDTSPCSTQACCTPHGTQAPTPPPLVCMQATPSLLPSPQQPPPQCLYNQHHLTNPIALQLASPNFSTQTGGEKGALALTISATPPFAHPPPLCRSSHLCGCPHCASQVMCPTAHACPPSLHACQGVQEGQHAHPSPLQPGYAIPPPPSLCPLPCPHAFPL